MVESKGYEKLGNARWQLVGDGIVHHLMLRPGLKTIPDSFRDFDASFFPELELLRGKCGLPHEASKLPAGKGQYHSGGLDLIAGQDYWRQREAWEAENPPREESLWEWFISWFSSQQEITFNQVYEPPLGWKWRDFTPTWPERGAWTLTLGSFEDVVGSVIETWEKSSWPEVQELPSWQAFYEKHYRARVESTKHFVADHIIYAYLGGDHHQIQKIVDRVASDFCPSVDQNFEKLWNHYSGTFNGLNWKKHRKTPEGLKELRGMALNATFNSMSHLRQSKQIGERLGIDIRLPDVDYSLLETFDRVSYLNKPPQDG